MSSSFITARNLAMREGLPSTKERTERHRAKFIRTHPLAAQRIGKAAAVEPVYARVDFGRWIADCECGGAEYVDPDYPWYFCNSCGNSGCNGQLRPIIIPEAAEREAIEKTLNKRPVDDTRGSDEIQRAILSRPIIARLARSWEPGETVDDLKAQNRKAGLK